MMNALKDWRLGVAIAVPILVTFSLMFYFLCIGIWLMNLIEPAILKLVFAPIICMGSVGIAVGIGVILGSALFEWEDRNRP